MIGHAWSSTAWSLAIAAALASPVAARAQQAPDFELRDTSRFALSVGSGFRAWPSIGGGAQGVAAIGAGQFRVGILRLRGEGALAPRDPANSGGAGSGLLDGRVTLDIAPVHAGPLWFDAAVGVERDAYDPMATWTQQGAQLRGWISSERGGAWAGFGVRAPQSSTSTPPATEARAGGWWHLGAVTLSGAVSVVTTRNSVRIVTDSSQAIPGTCTVSYDAGQAIAQYRTTCYSQFGNTDGTLAAAWMIGPVAVRLNAGARFAARSPFGSGLESWAGGSAVAPITDRAAVMIDVGRRPVDLVRGTPSYTRVMAGLVVRLAGTPLPTGAERRDTGRAPPAAIEVGPCAADGTREFRLRVREPGASAAVRGDFSEWRDVPLVTHADGWATARLRMAPGVHQVMQRVGSAPWQPPEGLPVADDGFGGVVGVLVVPAVDRQWCAPGQ